MLEPQASGERAVARLSRRAHAGFAILNSYDEPSLTVGLLPVRWRQARTPAIPAPSKHKPAR